MKKKQLYCLLIILFLGGINTSLLAEDNKKFTLVLDPGHGGKDPGAIGSKSKEKDIVLAVSLLVGKKIEKEFSDVKVLYTRSTDVYPTLSDRSAFANKNHANLFISIHANSAGNKSVHGAETFLLGVDKMQSNLDVAMKENAVMLLEDDYESHYQGFDPNSVESYIMFEFIQNQYVDNSVLLASLTQNKLINACKRKDRGVRQGPFWVLHSVACPSILIELGFISNASDEAYMTSKKGQSELATGIYNAFVEYKKSVDAKSNVEVVSSKEKNKEDKEKPVYKLQIFSVNKKLESDSRELRRLKDVDYYSENGWYKYTVGNETDYDEIIELKEDLKRKYPDAFVVAFVKDKKISVSEARKMK